MTKTHHLQRTQVIDKPLEEVFDFFADAANLQALTPEFLKFKILTPMPVEMREDARLEYSIKLFGVPVKWRTRISVWEPGVRFVDEQESGPYAIWRHTHTFEAQGNQTVMRDEVEYVEPLGWLGAIAHTLFVERTLARIFDYREDAVSRIFEQPSPQTPNEDRHDTATA